MKNGLKFFHHFADILLVREIFTKNIFYEINLDRCKPTNVDIENRQQILKELEKQFKEDYSDCNLHAFGSFYNGFGFRKSDLDVCIVFKDEREQNVCILFYFVLFLISII